MKQMPHWEETAEIKTATAIVQRAQKEEDQSATGLLLRTYSAGPVVYDLLRCIRPRAGNALQPSMTRLHNEELVN